MKLLQEFSFFRTFRPLKHSWRGILRVYDNTMIHTHKWTILIEEVGICILPLQIRFPDPILLIHFPREHKVTTSLGHVSPQYLRHIELLWHTKEFWITLY